MEGLGGTPLSVAAHLTSRYLPVRPGVYATIHNNNASREPSDTPPGSQLSRICTQRHIIYNFVLSGFQVSLSAQSTPLGESLSRSNQRGSKTPHACYSHPRCKPKLARLIRFSLPLPKFGRLFLFLHLRGHKPIAPLTKCVISDPRVKYGGAPVPRDAK